MQTITTKFTKQLKITSPIVLAPMAFGSTAEMAAIVSGAGGFGFFPAGFDSSGQIKRNFASIRQSLSVPNGEPIPTGIGFIGWILDITESSSDPRLAAALAEKPAAIWFAFGIDLGKYIAQVRAYNEQRSDNHKTLVFVIVNSAEDALRAVNEWQVDVLVVQGIEAGGHGGSEAPPLFSLLPAVLAAFPAGDCPPILAAGGISTGAQVASLLVLGASGVAVGTRFLYTPESIYTDQMKDVLVKAGWGATARGLMFDEVNRTMGWPPKHDGRAIANDIMSDFKEGLTLEERMKRFDESKAKSQAKRLVIWAGVGVGMTKDIKPTKDVFRELHEDAVERLKLAPGLLSQ